MGVSGLWDILAPAGRPRSLAKLAIDAFESNLSGKRAYRVGIDASIWYKHAAYSKGGENAELRLLFFRINSLIRLPLLPLFVFDGRWGRPKMKRGNRMGKSGIPDLTRNMKTLLDIFGIEWREARGEAEVELAFLNSVGIIDAIMTDDVDAFLFGANTIIRNPSLNLIGNRSNPATNLDGKPSNRHVMEFRIEDIQINPEIRMSRGGMILFALLTGGDYDNGIDKIGKATAHALVRCGFGDELYSAVLNRDVVSLHNFLPTWRERINTELRENRQGFLRRAAPGLCLPNNFPNLELLDKYVRPERNEGGIQGVWKNRELNLPQLAAFCEEYFEWGTRTQIIKRFRSLLWDASVIRLLRKAALEQDKKEVDRQYPPGTPYERIRHCQRPELCDAVGTSMSLVSRYLKHNTTIRSDIDRRISAAFTNKGPVHSSFARESDDPRSFIIKIHGERRHVSTDRSLEYRIEVDPEVLVQLANSGIKGTRPEQGQSTTSDNDAVDDRTTEGSEDEGTATRKREPKEPLNPLRTLRMWCPAPMILRVNPGLIEEYDRVQEEKKQKVMRKASGSRETASTRGRGQGKGRRRPRDSDNETETEAEDADSPRPSPQKRRRATVRQDVSNKFATVRPSNCNNSMPSDVFSDVISTPARPTDNISRLEGRNHTALTSSISISTVTTTASHPVDTTSRDKANESACRASGTIQDVPAFSPQLRWTVSQRPRISSDHWDTNDSSSLFLFSIPDPCNPEFIEREDLRNRAPEPVFRWSNISSSVTHTYDRDEDEGFVSDDGELDRSFQRDFIRKAQQTNASYVLGGARKTAKPQVSDPDTLVLEDPLSVFTNGVGKKFSQITSSVSKTLRQRQISSALDRNLPDYGRDIPLFLLSRSSSPILVEQSSSQTTTHSMTSTPDSDVIVVDSSDEEFDFPSSSFIPPSSYLASSPATSQRRNERSHKKHQFANCSQDSGIAMCDDDDYLDLTHL
ncbi:hypothetical protein ACEPAG_7986 [Sanghuangporus baumii]